MVIIKLAVTHANIAIGLSPTDPHVFFVEHALMTAHFFRKDLERAEALALSVLERKPGHASALKVRIATLGHLGRIDEAARYIDVLRGVSADITIQTIVSAPSLIKRDLDYYVEGLRAAGVPDN